MKHTVSKFFLTGLFLMGVAAVAQTEKQKLWADSLLKTLNTEQKIAQLCMVAAYSNKDEKHVSEIESLIVNHQIGGLIFMQGGPGRQIRLYNRFQTASKIPLLIGIDGEWGLAMRLDSTLSYPKQMTLGAIQDNNLIHDMGKQIARECKRVGVHLNFAPVVDVNVNPQNPVIGYRAFGEQKEMVSLKGLAYARGLQAERVMASAKHFPGHGDTDTDSHYALPVIKHKKQRIEDIELYPFRQLIKDSIASIMVGHLQMPAFESDETKATTLSENVVTKLLKEKYEYQGLVITDALNMKGVAKFYKPGEVELKAYQAGNDILLFCEDVPKAIKLITNFIGEDKNKLKDLDSRVRKVLMAKQWCGLEKFDSLSAENIQKDLKSDVGQMLRYRLFEKAITLVKNQQSLIPIKSLDTLKFASVCIGSAGANTFTNTLNKYAPFKHFYASGKEEAAHYQLLLKKLENYNNIVIAFHYLSNNPKANFGLNAQVLDFVKRIPKNKNVIVVIFGNAYALKNFDSQENLICAYEDNDATRKIVPQIIFGASKAEGKLPVTVSENIKFGDGYLTMPLKRLKHSPFPDWHGVDAMALAKIDSIVKVAMDEKAMPGCQILVARNGAVVYDKSFGRFTYDTSSARITDTTLYDVASVTKVAATLQAAMFLYGIDSTFIYKTLDKLLDSLPKDKSSIIMQEVLSHQAGLQPFLDHWRKTMEKKDHNPAFYSYTKDSIFTMLVAPNLYAIPSLKDSIWKWTLNAPLMNKKDSCYKYRYSDIGFYILQKVVEKHLQKPLDEFCHDLYRKLGMSHSTFNPLLNGYTYEDCVPTENDKLFRKRIIQGTVHDEGAAMYGGVAGHAGLFSNANDLAILFQMNLQDGVYGDERYFKTGTVEHFRKRHMIDNRRGLGWDKPELNGGGPTSKSASTKTYGHQGFTGTCVWIDPKYNLIYVFISNRTYPSVDNKKLVSLNVRTTIHDAIYLAVNKHDEKKKLNQPIYRF